MSNEINVPWQVEHVHNFYNNHKQIKIQDRDTSLMYT